MQQVRYVITPLALGALVLGGAATASADSGEADFGTPQQVAVGPAVIAYTVGEPQPSTDQVICRAVVNGNGKAGGPSARRQWGQ